MRRARDVVVQAPIHRRPDSPRVADGHDVGIKVDDRAVQIAAVHPSDDERAGRASRHTRGPLVPVDSVIVEQKFVLSKDRDALEG